MRELTLAEFDLIAGGDTTTVSGVTIIASSGMGWGWGWGSWGIGGGYGDGGGVDTSPREPPPPPQPTESQIDSQACAAAASIRAQAHYSTQEYGYFIITDADGTTRLSPIFTSGLGGKIDFGGDGALSLEELGISDWSQVKGFVHNHPYETDSPYIPGDINLINRRPSDADWDLMSQIVGAGGGGNSDFRLYIIGPDGVARQYNPDSPHNQTSNDTSGGNCH
ncbi:hypothetical protein QO010_000157 [Caulobacter ginsengisoli]|uniref:JAB domain-containing protein n=1 Tax=Caulobacter ginsengisoli TaxID=400775 RepID=A0ABU0IKD1_9CAUL|nr:hypothetical protein [Caulobacter ginsengisoli]MDQ0462409.1 hypothetical protein [Caulobacter ginsengisoli]